MARTDVKSWASIPNFSAISTPRRIRLADNFKDGTGGIGPAWDFLEIAHRADTVVYVGINGATAASTASTSLVPSFVTSPTPQPIFGVVKTAPLSIHTHATSLSVQATGATSVAVTIRLGRY